MREDQQKLAKPIMSIEITPDSKTLRNYRIVFALCGLNLVTIFGPNFLGFDSFLNLPSILEGMAATLTGIGFGLLFFKGMFNFNIPVILINETEIHVKHDYWSQSFAWNKLKRVTLYKNRIELTYNQSGHTDYIKLSHLLRSRSPDIRDALQEVCSFHDIDFVVLHPYRSISASYGLQNNH